MEILLFIRIAATEKYILIAYPSLIFIQWIVIVSLYMQQKEVISFTNMTVVSPYEDRRKTARALYEQYGKPLEAEHKGEYVVISNSGNTIVGKSLTEVVTNAIAKFGKGHFVFKIGSRAIGSFR
jgi:hypothetical protein